MTRLHQSVTAELLADIAAGRLSVGERLPTLPDLADQFKVGIGVIRECQLALEQRGILSVHQGRRAIVNPEEEWDVFDPEVLTALVRSDRGGHVLGEYLEARRVLEVEAAGLAAERADPGAIGRLADAFASMRSAAAEAEGNRAAEPLYHHADVEFHRAVTLTAGNRPLARMAEPLHAALSAILAELARPQLRFERGLPEHERILEAIAAGDAAGARLAMREHLLTVEGYLRERNAAADGRGAAGADARGAGAPEGGAAVGA